MVRTAVGASSMRRATQRVLARQQCFTTKTTPPVVAPASVLLQQVSLERLAHQSKLQLQLSGRARTSIEIVPVLAASEFAIKAFSASGHAAGTELYDVMLEEQTPQTDNTDASGTVTSVRITNRADAADEDEDAPPTTLQLALPHLIDLNVSVARGDVRVHDKFEGDVKIVVGDGDIRVHKLRGEALTLKTNRGAIDIASLLEGERVQLVASHVACKRLMAGATDVKLHKISSSSDSGDAAMAPTSHFGAIYSSACVIQSLAAGTLEVDSVHGYLRVASEALTRVRVHSVNGALELEDSGARCDALVHFDAWPADAMRSSIVVGGDVRVSVAPTAALTVELHGSAIATDGCAFATRELEQLDADYAIVTGTLQATASSSGSGSGASGTSGKINVGSAKDAAMRTSFFMVEDDSTANTNNASSSSSDDDDGDDDDKPQLLVHATSGTVQLEQLDWMAKLKRKHLTQQ